MVGVLAPRQEARLADEMEDIGPADEETRRELASSNERREDPFVESPPHLVQSDERALVPKNNVEVPDAELKEELTEIKIFRTTNALLDALEEEHPGSKQEILRKLALR
jgi:hypothetical protein